MTTEYEVLDQFQKWVESNHPASSATQLTSLKYWIHAFSVRERESVETYELPEPGAF
jgi:hypothetical protein